MPRTKNSADPAKAVAYLRVSTSRQDLSPRAQRDAILRWAERQGVSVVSWHEDLGVSGGAEVDRRPGLLAAIEALKAQGAGVLLVARRDRLARSVFTDALIQRLVERHGAVVRSADGVANGDRPEDQLMRSIVAAMASYERALVGARTRAALAVKREKGERLGGIPYGRRLGHEGALIDDPEEQATIARARELRAEGLSLRAIGRALIEEGRTPRAARRWHVGVLARLVG